MDRVFLDANVLFSASYSDRNRLLELWNLENLELITSALATRESMRNLSTEIQRGRLKYLLAGVSIVSEPSAESTLPHGIVLPSKDVPILLAAIRAKATHLLTGDKRHFGSLFERVIDGVLVQRPAMYLHGRGV